MHSVYLQQVWHLVSFRGDSFFWFSICHCRIFSFSMKAQCMKPLGANHIDVQLVAITDRNSANPMNFENKKWKQMVAFLFVALIWWLFSSPLRNSDFYTFTGGIALVKQESRTCVKLRLIAFTWRVIWEVVSRTVESKVRFQIRTLAKKTVGCWPLARP